MSRFRRTGSRSLAVTANEENRGLGDHSAIRHRKCGSGLRVDGTWKVATWYARSRRWESHSSNSKDHVWDHASTGC
jgi:hypothetical protein